MINISLPDKLIVPNILIQGFTITFDQGPAKFKHATT